MIKDMGMKSPEAAMFKINIYHIPGNALFSSCTVFFFFFSFFPPLYLFTRQLTLKGLVALRHLMWDLLNSANISRMRAVSVATSSYCEELQRREADEIL